MMLAAFVVGATAGAQTAAAWRAGLALIIAIGAVQVYLAIRIEFDRRIFERVVEAPQGWSGFDDAMRKLELMPAAKMGRPPAARAAGLATLVRWHAGLLVAQLLLALALLGPA